MGKHSIIVEHGINILKMLNEAIGRMHIRGIAHRDVKPDNILVSDDF